MAASSSPPPPLQNLESLVEKMYVEMQPQQDGRCHHHPPNPHDHVRSWFGPALRDAALATKPDAGVFLLSHGSGGSHPGGPAPAGFVPVVAGVTAVHTAPCMPCTAAHCCCCQVTGRDSTGCAVSVFDVRWQVGAGGGLRASERCSAGCGSLSPEPRSHGSETKARADGRARERHFSSVSRGSNTDVFYSAVPSIRVAPPSVSQSSWRTAVAWRSTPSKPTARPAPQ